MSRNPKSSGQRLDWIAKVLTGQVLTDPSTPPPREERVALRLIAEGTRSPGRRGKRPHLVAAGHGAPIGLVDPEGEG
jgi:hypothetical protein